MVKTYGMQDSYGYGITDRQLAGGSNAMSLFGSVALPLLGGIFSGRSARKAQKRAIGFAREQMAFQERMSSTAYQRAAADLEKAGLNRILALGKPASSPSGAMPPTIDPGIAAASTALQLRRQGEELKLIRAQRRNVDMDTGQKAATTFRIDHETQNLMRLQSKIMLEAQGVSIDNEMKKLKIPSLQAEADFWRWLESGDLEELAKAIPIVGPALGGVIRSYVLFRRRHR